MENSPKKIDDVIKEFGEKLENKVSTPIVISGWAVNLHGYARATVDFDFMVKEEDFEQIKKTMNEIGYEEIVKTPLFARYSIPTENEDYPVIDCLFVSNKTYEKLKKQELLQISWVLILSCRHPLILLL